jgi:hypothetical protein
MSGFTNAWLTVLFTTVLDKPAPDSRLSNAHAFADVLDVLTLLLEHSNHFQLQTGIKRLTLSCCHV